MLLYFAKILFSHYKQKVMVFLYASLVLCFVQAAGLKHQFGDFTISYIDSVTFYNYLFSKADCYRKGVEYNQIKNPRAEYLFTHKAHEQKQIANADIKEQLLNNKWNLIKAYSHNFMWNSVTGSICINGYSNVKGNPNFETNQPEIGKLTIDPAGKAKSIPPNSASFNCSFSLISGIRLAQLAKEIPAIKK